MLLTPRTHEAEANVVVPLRRQVVVPIRAAHVSRVVVPTAAAQHTIGSTARRPGFLTLRPERYYVKLQGLYVRRIDVRDTSNELSSLHEIHVVLTYKVLEENLSSLHLNPHIRTKVAQMSDNTHQALLHTFFIEFSLLPGFDVTRHFPQAASAILRFDANKAGEDAHS